jgi:hypothetical protein
VRTATDTGHGLAARPPVLDGRAPEKQVRSALPHRSVDGMDLTRILSAVEEAFARAGGPEMAWEDPWPYGKEPREDQYSRCLNPGKKYRILRVRGEAWAQALSGLGLAAVEAADTSAVWREPSGREVNRVLRVRPAEEQAIPLVLEYSAVEGEPEVHVRIGAGDPAVPAQELPHCGCDACDNGSDQLLEEFDEYVSAVVGGEFVHVAGKRGSAVRTAHSASAESSSTRAGYSALTAAVRRGEGVRRRKYRAVHGSRWW